METIKLKSMTDFVLEFSKTNHNSDEFENIVTDYAEFLKQPLQLGFFVPCNLEGHHFDLRLIKAMDKSFDDEQERLLNEARERVLFKGFEWDCENDCVEYVLCDSGKWIFGAEDLENETIETFGGIENQIELTETAIKQIGL